jgi:hypothetical protein
MISLENTRVILSEWRTVNILLSISIINMIPFVLYQENMIIFLLKSKQQTSVKTRCLSYSLIASRLEF